MTNAAISRVDHELESHHIRNVEEDNDFVSWSDGFTDGANVGVFGGQNPPPPVFDLPPPPIFSENEILSGKCPPESSYPLSSSYNNENYGAFFKGEVPDSSATCDVILVSFNERLIKLCGL